MLSNLFVAASDTSLPSYVIAIFAIIPAILVGAVIGFFAYRTLLKRKQIDANTEFNRVIDEAKVEAENLRKDALVDAKHERIRLRDEFDNEIKERRAEFQKTERRLFQKEEALERKFESLNRRIEEADKVKEENEKIQTNLKSVRDDLNSRHEKMLAELEAISGMTRDDAKSMLVEEMQDEAKAEALNIIKQIEQDARNEGEKKAREIVSMAIQRCAVDQASETTISVVALPSDEMKGRIIGRVGRNIKALESVTGVDVIIDDTPDIVTLTGFDPVRREIARITLNRLIADGRIHPGRIEEVAEKVRREMDAEIKEAGENAAYDTGVYGLHPEIVKLLGRMKYRTSYGQNVLQHSIEVSYLAGLLASEVGANVKLAKRAGLLHDLGKSVDYEYEGTHVQIGVEIAKKYKESDEVVNAIASHHGDVEPKTVEAILVQAADAISGARPGARRESLDLYIKRLENIESLANSFAGVEQSFAIHAGREIRVIVKPDEVDDVKTEYLAKDIAKKLEEELEYPGQIKVNVIREVRKVEYAK